MTDLVYELGPSSKVRAIHLRREGPERVGLEVELVHPTLRTGWIRKV